MNEEKVGEIVGKTSRQTTTDPQALLARKWFFCRICVVAEKRT